MNDNTDNRVSEIQTEIGHIEANLAFFEARFALIQHQPDTAYKRSQLKAYEALQEQLKSKLQDLQAEQKRQRSKNT